MRKKLWLTIIAVSVLLSSLMFALPVVAQDECPQCPCGCEGLTPGYWKNHTDAWECYSPGTLLGDIFTFPASFSNLADDTLLEALQYKGGNDVEGAARIFLRQAVAALLNACSTELNYPYTEAQVIDIVNIVLGWQDRDAFLWNKDVLEAANELGTSS